MNGNMFFGWLLITIGGLVATLSGGCGLGISLMVIPEMFRSGMGNASGFMVELGMFSGIPFAVGCLLVYAGRNLLRGKNHSNRDDIL